MKHRAWVPGIVAAGLLGCFGARAQDGVEKRPAAASPQGDCANAITAKAKAECTKKGAHSANSAAGDANDAAAANDGGARRAGGVSAASPAVASPATADVFAFPEDRSKHGADPDGLPSGNVPDPPASSEQPLPGSSSSSSSSGSGGASSSKEAQPDDDADVAPTTADPHAPVKAAKLKDLGSRGDSTEARKKLEATRVEDDVRVGGFYLKDGNLPGAYLRYKDAVEHDPADPDAQFGLAETARRMNRADEAVAHYRECLNIDAGGDHAKAARKALAQLQVQAKR